jgi:polysaccharide export outer membrane protein
MAGLLASAGAVLAQEKAALAAPVPATVPAAATAPRAAAMMSGSDEYRIGAHDLIEISVFQAQELSRTVRVNSAGKISLPMLGTVQAGGLTAQELEAEIATKLGEKFLQDPQVSVFMKEFVSQRVVIEGRVKKNGVYPLSGRTTLLQAIAMAEGLDPLANENEVKIFRQHGDGRKEVMTFDLESIRAGRAEDPLVKGNDVVVVDASAAKSFIKNVTDTLRGFIGFGSLY